MTDLPAKISRGPFAGLREHYYKAIYMDSPWTFLTRSGKGKGRSAENHYSTMTLTDIKALPIPQIAAKDCVLFFWVIDTHLPMALDMIEGWGFQYKTRAFCWAKQNKVSDGFFTGMGFWTRANPEDCLLATRGRPKRVAKDVRRLIVSPVREHSRKPDEAIEGIERLVEGPYIELFSRSNRDGWDSWGNETGKFDPLDPEALALL